MDFLEFNKKLQRVNKEVLISRSIKINSAAIVGLNVQQMEYGFTSRGKYIHPFLRSPKYSKIKKSAGGKAPLGVPDLKWTGAFHRGIKLQYNKSKYYMTSTDGKNAHLRRKYSFIFGLHAISSQKAKIMTTRTFSKLWRDKIGLS